MRISDWSSDVCSSDLAKQLGIDEDALECRVTTFHALGRGIIEETEGRPPQLANWVEHPAGEARVIDKIIRELMDTNEEFKRLWIDLLSILPKADLPAEAFDSEADYRSAERPVGKECVSKCRSRWWLSD